MKNKVVSYMAGFLTAMLIFFSILYFVGTKLHIIKVGYIEYVITVYVIYIFYKIFLRALPKRHKMPSMRMD